MLFTLEMYDTNHLPTTREGKGSLNADYATRMRNFLKLYDNSSSVDYSKGYIKFELEEELGDCSTFPYGFVSEDVKEAIKPCIFMKLNNIWSWKPEPIDAEDLQDNQDWPESLQSYVENPTEAELQQIPLDCQGESSIDKEVVREGLTFPKATGFPIKSFPYQGSNGMYHPPLVAIQFDGNKLTKYMEVRLDCKPVLLLFNTSCIQEMITIKCKAYYKGGPSQGEFRIRFQKRNFR